jgi:hypothetical protein
MENEPSQPVNPPAPEVSQPYSIPAGMTAEAARTRLEELKHDPEFVRRFAAGNKDSREMREFDALTRHAVGAEQPKTEEPKPGEIPGRPPGAPSPGAYSFPAPIAKTPEAGELATEARTLAFEQGLTPSEFTSIAEQQLADGQRFQGMSDEKKHAQLHSEMRAVWKENYDSYLGAVGRLLKDDPALDEKLDKLGLHYNKMVLWTLGGIAAARYGLGK